MSLSGRWYFVVGLVGTIGMLGLAGCGGNSNAATGPVQHVVITGNDDMKFVPSTVTVHPGTVEVTLKVRGTAPHNIDFPTLHAKSPVVLAGHQTSITLHVLAGHTYDFDCDLHVSEGMVGTMRVTS